VRRVAAIARTEFLGLVRSKMFVIGIVFMPLLVIGFGFTMSMLEDRVDREDRRFAVVDMSDRLYSTISAAAAAHNADAGEGEDRTGPHYLPERVLGDGHLRDDVLVDLSGRVREGELFAFLYLPADVASPGGRSMQYYSENTSYLQLPSWLEEILNEAIQEQRLTSAGLDPMMISSLVASTPLTSFELVQRQEDGTVAAQEVNELAQFGVPVFLLVLMFVTIMSSAQHLTNVTVEEKMSKITEVLLGSVSPFQLMSGRLLGIVSVSLLLAAVYLIGGAYAVLSFGRPDLIASSLIGWFTLFLICANLIYGSLFLALSAACSDLKDAQSLMQPVMVILIVAYVGSFTVLRAPDSLIAVIMSFIPLLTPFAMTLRVAAGAGPPLWQLLLSVVVLLGATVMTVCVAARVFRVGLLMQGKAPNLPELVRWVGR